MNKVILMGRLTKDPELRYTATDNIARCTFTLAVNRRFSKPGEERKADFINIVAWRKLAEFCSSYFKKGAKVVVIGSLHNRSWDDNEGGKHTVTEVVIDEAYFAESKQGSASAAMNTSESATGTSPESGYDVPVYFPSDNDDELPL